MDVSKRLLTAFDGGYECRCDSCSFTSRITFGRMSLSEFVGWLEECERLHSSKNPDCHERGRDE